MEGQEKGEWGGVSASSPCHGRLCCSLLALCDPVLCEEPWRQSSRPGRWLGLCGRDSHAPGLSLTLPWSGSSGSWCRMRARVRSSHPTASPVLRAARSCQEEDAKAAVGGQGQEWPLGGVCPVPDPSNCMFLRLGRVPLLTSAAAGSLGCWPDAHAGAWHLWPFLCRLCGSAWRRGTAVPALCRMAPASCHVAPAWREDPAVPGAVRGSLPC